jgi:hypothetical protein
LPYEPGAIDVTVPVAGGKALRPGLRIHRRPGVPEPEVNVRIDGFTVDFLWRQQRLVVETDGYRYHRGSVAFEADRDEPRDAIALVAARLAARAWRLPPGMREELVGGATRLR